MSNPARALALPLLLLLASLVAACVGSGGPTPTSPFGIDSPEVAAAAVAEHRPWFSAFKPKDPAMIGASTWYEAARTEAAKHPTDWNVRFTAGWGDCQAGCIDVHTWSYRVGADGSVALTGEAGPALPAEVIEALRAAVKVAGVGGFVDAGPACGGPARVDASGCDNRPGEGAVLVVNGANGAEVGRVVSDGAGLFRLALAPGAYTLVPQAVQGLMGTASPIPFTVTAGAETYLPVTYDTGMR